MNSSIFSSSVLFNYNYTIHWKVDKRNKKIKGKTAKSDDIPLLILKTLFLYNYSISTRYSVIRIKNFQFAILFLRKKIFQEISLISKLCIIFALFYDRIDHSSRELLFAIEHILNHAISSTLFPKYETIILMKKNVCKCLYPKSCFTIFCISQCNISL